MTVEDMRTLLYQLEHDERLTQAEVDMARIQTIGVLNKRPRTVGEAKRFIAALRVALEKATSEVPL